MSSSFYRDSKDALKNELIALIASIIGLYIIQILLPQLWNFFFATLLAYFVYEIVSKYLSHGLAKGHVFLVFMFSIIFVTPFSNFIVEEILPNISIPTEFKSAFLLNFIIVIGIWLMKQD